MFVKNKVEKADNLFTGNEPEQVFKSKGYRRIFIEIIVGVIINLTVYLIISIIMSMANLKPNLNIALITSTVTIILLNIILAFFKPKNFEIFQDYVSGPSGPLQLRVNQIGINNIHPNSSIFSLAKLKRRKFPLGLYYLPLCINSRNFEEKIFISQGYYTTAEIREIALALTIKIQQSSADETST